MSPSGGATLLPRLPLAYYPHPSVLLPLPSLAPGHTLALTKIDLVGPLGAAGVVWEIKVHSLCTCIENKDMCT